MSALFRIFALCLWILSSPQEAKSAHLFAPLTSKQEINKQGIHCVSDNSSLWVLEVQEDADDENQNSPWTSGRIKAPRKNYSFFSQNDFQGKYISLAFIGISRFMRFCNYRI